MPPWSARTSGRRSAVGFIGPANTGTTTLVVDRASGTLVGASVVGPRATEVLGMLALAIHARVPVAELTRMIYAFPTFYGGIGETLGAWGRGLVGVMDPGNRPLVDDPEPRAGLFGRAAAARPDAE